MTENNNEFDFKVLEDLIVKLEIKEAVENGDLGEIKFCLKHILNFINTHYQVQLRSIKRDTELVRNTDKLIRLNTELSEDLSKQNTKHAEVILKLVERVTALEEAKK